MEDESRCGTSFSRLQLASSSSRARTTGRSNDVDSFRGSTARDWEEKVGLFADRKMNRVQLNEGSVKGEGGVAMSSFCFGDNPDKRVIMC